MGLQSPTPKKRYVAHDAGTGVSFSHADKGIKSAEVLPSTNDVASHPSEALRPALASTVPVSAAHPPSLTNGPAPSSISKALTIYRGTHRRRSAMELLKEDWLRLPYFQYSGHRIQNRPLLADYGSDLSGGRRCVIRLKFRPLVSY